jgi:LemA protein
MNTTSIVSWVVLAVLVFWAVGAYNRLVRLRNSIGNAFAQIDVQLKRRYDLIPNLVEAAKKYIAHEPWRP